MKMGKATETNHIKMPRRTGDTLLRGRTVGCANFTYGEGVFCWRRERFILCSFTGCTRVSRKDLWTLPASAVKGPVAPVSVLCVSFILIQNSLLLVTRCRWLSPCQAVLLDTIWASHSLTQFWPCLPGDTVRSSHRLRAQSHHTSDANSQ